MEWEIGSGDKWGRTAAPGAAGTSSPLPRGEGGASRVEGCREEMLPRAGSRGRWAIRAPYAAAGPNARARARARSADAPAASNTT
jgi:hypothetical protein